MEDPSQLRKSPNGNCSWYVLVKANCPINQAMAPNFRRSGSSAIPKSDPKSINVTFKDGKKWEVRMRPNKKNVSAKELEATINEMFVHYKDAIKPWILGWMSSKVKADNRNRPKKFIKKNK